MREYFFAAFGLNPFHYANLKVSVLLGSEDGLERLNLLLQQRFLLAAHMSAVLQGMTNDLLFFLISRGI